MQLLRRSDSNSRHNVRPVAGVPDHRVSNKQTHEGVNNVYAVDTLEVRSKIGRFDTCNGNAKSARAFPGITESNGYCSMPSKQAEHCITNRWPCHSVRASPQSWARLFISKYKRRAYLTTLLEVLSTVPLLWRLHVSSIHPRGAGS